MPLQRLAMGALAALVGAASPAAATNLVLNGSFETAQPFSDLPASWFRCCLFDQFYRTDIPLSGGPTEGNYHLLVSYNIPDSGAFLYQWIATRPGATYNLGFDFATDDYGQYFSVSWSDQQASNRYFIIPKTPYLQPQYERFNFSLVAVGTTTVLEFGFYGANGLALLDNIVLTEAGVPESSTWAMLIIGFGLVGTMTRRRRLAA